MRWIIVALLIGPLAEIVRNIVRKVSESWGWFVGLFTSAEPECAVLEIADEENGRKLWDIPELDGTPRRYFFVSCRSERVDHVRWCAQNNGLPRVGDQHPTTKATVEEITIRRDALNDVWQAMVTYTKAE